MALRSGDCRLSPHVLDIVDDGDPDQKVEISASMNIFSLARRGRSTLETSTFEIPTLLLYSAAIILEYTFRVKYEQYSTRSSIDIHVSVQISLSSICPILPFDWVGSTLFDDEYEKDKREEGRSNTRRIWSAKSLGAKLSPGPTSVLLFHKNAFLLRRLTIRFVLARAPHNDLLSSDG